VRYARVLYKGVAPFPGATTGTGGRIRDVQATGRGAHVIAGTAGYCFGNLHIPGDRTFLFLFCYVVGCCYVFVVGTLPCHPDDGRGWICGKTIYLRHCDE